MPHSAFDTLPIIDLSLANNPDTKPRVLDELRYAVFNVGFMYIRNTGIPEDVILKLKDQIPKLFDLPLPEKMRLAMENKPFFTGYTALGNEITANAKDGREQFDFAHEHAFDWKEGDLNWKKMRGPNLWPSSDLLPAFRPALENYLKEVTLLSRRFLHLVAEALELAETEFDKYADPEDDNYSRLKIVKYPPVEGFSQGCGPHKDSIGLWTFLLQADNEPGLQVLNAAGEWIDATPIEGTLVVNIAAGFEAITGGLCPATTHRVLIASKNPRYSVPFFMGMKFDTTLADLKANVPNVVQNITGSRKRIDNVVSSEFLDPAYECLGEAHLRNRIISHPDVGKRWYPELYAKYTSAN